MNSTELGMVLPSLRLASDRFQNDSQPSQTIGEFWAWAMSDLLSNTTRGLLDEFLVARALGDPTPVRDPWRPFDVVTDEGIRVEVKSCAYLQAWAQKKHSPVSFGIRPTKAWDAAVGDFVGDPCRQAEVYVFALLAEMDKASVDPANVSQWSFYVLPTALLNQECATAESLSLRRVQELGARPIPLADLKDAVRAAANFR